MSDADSFEEDPPAGFLALSNSDQSSKLRRRREIEANWGCDIQDCVPLKIRARVTGRRGVPVRAADGEDATFKQWWQWSVEYLTKIAKISFMTAGKLEFAQELMVLEVEERQRSGLGALQLLSELRMKDVERIADALLKAYEAGAEMNGQNNSNDYDDDDSERSTPETETKDDQGSQTTQTRETSQSHQASLSVKREVSDEQSSSLAPPKRQRVIKSVNVPARVAALRGRAMRCEQEAAKLKAEAYEIESKWLTQNSA